MGSDVLKKAIQSAEESKKKGVPTLSKRKAISQGLKLIDKSKICMLGTNGEYGYPNIKAMLNLKHEGLKKIWFSTNTSSQRVQQLRKDNRACVYYVDANNFTGMMLVGTIEILQDIESKKILWSEGAEVYYPLGVADPDYSVLCFSSKRGNFYHSLKNINFEIE
jgi:general stress protein 26